MASKDQNHINNKKDVAQARGCNSNKTKSKGVLLQWKNVHISLMITYKLLSSQHKRKVNDVIMSFFLTTPRSHGTSRERRRSHIISAWYLTKKLPGPRPGYPRTQLEITTRVLSTKVHNQGSIQASNKDSLEHI